MQIMRRICGLHELCENSKNCTLRETAKEREVAREISKRATTEREIGEKVGINERATIKTKIEKRG